MNCESPVFTIFTNDSKTMKLRAVYKNTYLPFDISTATQIIVYLPNADGTFSQRKLSLGDVVITSPGNLGLFTATIPAVVAALLNVGELQNVDVVFTIGGLDSTVRFYGALSVYQAP